jgi:hypothetical protein
MEGGGYGGALVWLSVADALVNRRTSYRRISSSASSCRLGLTNTTIY